jgi:phosphopantothenoylcysteine decarboxylase/phosphopantothenate--cysteine ligase
MLARAASVASIRASMKAFEWDYSHPQSVAIGDHDVLPESVHLAGKRVALLVCGGIAAMKTPQLARALRRRGAEVVAFCSDEALHFVGREALEWATLHPLVTRLTWRSEHLSDATPFDAYLLAPATYNTIGKMASGIADTVITSALASAMGRLAAGAAQILVAPTMHGSMHHEVFVENCRKLSAAGLRFVPPRDEYGKHNLPDEGVIVAAVCRALSKSPLAKKRALVTAGPTPVPIDGVRRILNRFRGKLGALIHEELLLRGADSALILGDGAWRPRSWIPVEIARTYDDYKAKVLEHVATQPDFGIFSAGVADYRPRTAAQGKLPSGQKDLRLELEPTEKVIDLAVAAAPSMFTVSFKYQEKLSRDELLGIARARLDRYPVVVANRGEEINYAEQSAYIVTRDGETRVEGKRRIAAAVADLLEAQAHRAG